MRFIEIRAQQYRNIDFAAVPLSQNTYFYGKNGQGKTNLLEGLNFVTALRSFRTHESNTLIQHGKTMASLYYKIEHEVEGECEVRIDITPKGKTLQFNQNPVRQNSDFIGIFPTVAFSSEDIHLVRGAPLLRRRFLDLSLAATDREYLTALLRYHKGLKERNALFRHEKLNIAALEAFDALLAQDAVVLIRKRQQALLELDELLESYHNSVSIDEELPQLQYQPNTEAQDPEHMLAVLQKSRERDYIMKATQKGPHRDDFLFRLQSNKAQQFSSEGQQRTLVIALRLAQVAYFEKKKGIIPVILADDILGQLDSRRREAFWKTLDDRYQIICTGTEKPELLDQPSWQFTAVQNGAYHQEEVLGLS